MSGMVWVVRLVYAIAIAGNAMYAFHGGLLNFVLLGPLIFFYIDFERTVRNGSK